MVTGAISFGSVAASAGKAAYGLAKAIGIEAVHAGVVVDVFIIELFILFEVLEYNESAANTKEERAIETTAKISSMQKAGICMSDTQYQDALDNRRQTRIANEARVRTRHIGTA